MRAFLLVGLWFSLLVFSLPNRQNTALCAFVTRDGSSFVTTCNGKRCPGKKQKRDRIRTASPKDGGKSTPPTESPKNAPSTPRGSSGAFTPRRPVSAGVADVAVRRASPVAMRRRRVGRAAPVAMSRRRRHQPGWRDVDARARGRANSPDQAATRSSHLCLARVPVRDVLAATRSLGRLYRCAGLRKTPGARQSWQSCSDLVVVPRRAPSCSVLLPSGWVTREVQVARATR